MPLLLYILFSVEPRMSIASSMYVASWIKLITLTWGIIKFTKLRFFWLLLPFNTKHNYQENIRRCFKLNLYRVLMITVNMFHIFAILIVILNIIMSSKGSKFIITQSLKKINKKNV